MRFLHSDEIPIFRDKNLHRINHRARMRILGQRTKEPGIHVEQHNIWIILPEVSCSQERVFEPSVLVRFILRMIFAVFAKWCGGLIRPSGKGVGYGTGPAIPTRDSRFWWNNHLISSSQELLGFGSVAITTDRTDPVCCDSCRSCRSAKEPHKQSYTIKRLYPTFHEA